MSQGLMLFTNVWANFFGYMYMTIFYVVGSEILMYNQDCQLSLDVQNLIILSRDKL